MKNNTKKLVIASLFAAIVFVATFIIRIPSPMKGYINPGDVVVLLCGWALGPVWGFLSAGIGSMLADLVAGYAIYAPVTFFIKGLMATVAWIIYRCLKNTGILSKVISGIVAELIMVLGYFVFEAILYGVAGAALNIIPNCVQGVFGIVVGVIFMTLIEKRNLFKI